MTRSLKFGFTLIEVCVALALLSSGVLVFGRFIDAYNRVCALERDQARALVRASAAVEALVRTPPSCADASFEVNGVQVENTADITCIAFAVDACMETFRRAREAGAQMVFVHHGLFWGHEQCITGSHYRRLKFLMENNMALYAAHLPLDIHPDIGNNVSLAKAAGLEDLKPFGEFRGIKVGVKGSFRNPVTTEEVLSRLGYDRAELLACLSYRRRGPCGIPHLP